MVNSKCASGQPLQMTDASLPVTVSTTAAISTIVSCVAMTAPNTISGTTTNGTKAFANTAVASDTGRDFQNRMLRSRRSLLSALRQKKKLTTTPVIMIAIAEMANGAAMAGAG